ncbi:MAG TPA: cysteine desulfurase [Acidobacteriota bacterium]
MSSTPISSPVPAKGSIASELDVEALRRDFPILEREVHGRPLIYIDNAATTQKPLVVLEALERYYRRSNANVHRGIHALAEEATAAYEATRGDVARLLGGVDPRGVVFTRNATEALNLVARGWGEKLSAGDEVLLTEMEHHSNLVPWLQLAKARGVQLRHLPIRDDGELELAALDRLLGPRTKIVSLTHVSNVLGTINPVAQIAAAAHTVGAVMVVDGAQSVPHMPVDFAALGCDFLAFSAHKMMGPTGVGVLVGKPERLEAMEPLMGGGEMIREVHLDRATWNDIPHKFEAGTPNIADVVAFAAAIRYLEKLGLDAVRAHELRLTAYALERLNALGFLTLYGPPSPERRGGVVTFNDPLVHPHDLSTILDQFGIAIRAGHHCAQPLMRRLGVVATARASFYVYNSESEIDALAQALLEARRYFGHATTATR